MSGRFTVAVLKRKDIQHEIAPVCKISVTNSLGPACRGVRRPPRPYSTHVNYLGTYPNSIRRLRLISIKYSVIGQNILSRCTKVDHGQLRQATSDLVVRRSASVYSRKLTIWGIMLGEYHIPRECDQNIVDLIKLGRIIISSKHSTLRATTEVMLSRTFAVINYTGESAQPRLFSLTLSKSIFCSL